MKTLTGIHNFPAIKINGTNALLQQFEKECKTLGFQVSKANDYFRDDYEHCLMPAYAYYKGNRTNIKLQLLSSDVYFPELEYDLKTEYSLALSMVEVINQYNSNVSRETPTNL